MNQKHNSRTSVSFLPTVNQALSLLADAFPRQVSFHYFCLIIFGMIMRVDTYGVTALIRGVGLGRRSYESLIKHFERLPVDLGKLAEAWAVCVFAMLEHCLYEVNGRLVVVGDSIKVAKCGRRMVAVKRLRTGRKKASKAAIMCT